MAEYILDQKPTETLQQYYRRLAKTADQRLVRLEKASKEKYYKPATEWAYAKAQYDIKKWQKPGAGEPGVLRFNTKPPEGEKLIAKINDIKSFLASPTSTKSGITNVYKKRADTINARYGTNFNWKQLAKYFDTGMADLWDAKFGSKTALKAIGYIQKNKEQIKKAIKDADNKNIKLPGKSTVVKRAVKKALAENNLKIEDLL